jgi:hypothetical protein
MPSWQTAMGIYNPWPDDDDDDATEVEENEE